MVAGPWKEEDGSARDTTLEYPHDLFSNTFKGDNFLDFAYFSIFKQKFLEILFTVPHSAHLNVS